ncbi:helix-turn-helix transcriptional regulator [Mycobacteroides abscessus subsp. abscessus]
MGDEKAEQWVPKRVSEADAAVGAVLRRVRERAGWTLEQAGERSGINRSVLSKTE